MLLAIEVALDGSAISNTHKAFAASLRCRTAHDKVHSQARQSTMPRSMRWCGRSSGLMGSGSTLYRQVSRGWPPLETRRPGVTPPFPCLSRFALASAFLLIGHSYANVILAELYIYLHFILLNFLCSMSKQLTCKLRWSMSVQKSSSLCIRAPALGKVSAEIRVTQVPMFSSSGLRVQYLKVWEKSSYKVDKWVRKVSKSGDYQVRTQ